MAPGVCVCVQPERERFFFLNILSWKEKTNEYAVTILVSLKHGEKVLLTNPKFLLNI